MAKMISLDPSSMPTGQIQSVLTAGVAPRPIALVSTVSHDGKSNLAPFSFFNAVGSQPPHIVFSPARRVRDGGLKDTYHNLMQTGQCVVHMVNYAMVEQMNLASGEYDHGVNEFEKSGFTSIESDVVTAKRIKESPFHMECELRHMIQLGGNPGSGNLAICEVLRFHVSEDVYDRKHFHIKNLDHVGRNGGSYYTRSFEKSMFELEMPRREIGMGFDQLPADMLNTTRLQAKHLATLASLSKKPSLDSFTQWISASGQKKLSPKQKEKALKEKNYTALLADANQRGEFRSSQKYTWIKWALEQGCIDHAWMIWMCFERKEKP
ncbi:MAG: flavin reductase family protein [Bdellovibrionota bacterium]